MSENPIENIVEDMKSPESFDLGAAINGTSYPEDDVSVYLEGALMHRVNVIAHELEFLHEDAKRQSAKENGGITDSPEKVETDEKIAELEAEQEELLAKVQGSKLTFHMRGVAPAVWRAIDKKWRAKIKPASQSDEDVTEANITRNDKVNNDLIAHAIVSVTNSAGAVDKSGISLETMETLHGTLLQSEYFKIKNMAEQLTFASNLFNAAIEQDADFLPQP